jgi:recombination protein RecA
LVPKAEIEGEMGEQHMGLQARLMSQALRKLTGIVSKSKTIVIFINQIRLKIGIVFGNPETTTGGNALKFYSSVRIEVRRSAQIKQLEKVKPLNNVKDNQVMVLLLSYELIKEIKTQLQETNE